MTAGKLPDARTPRAGRTDAVERRLPAATDDFGIALPCVLGERVVGSDPAWKDPVDLTPCGPSSSARSLTNMANPGRSPLDSVKPGIGDRAEEERTNAMLQPVPKGA